MAVRNDRLDGDDWSDGEVLDAEDLNDTFDAVVDTGLEPIRDMGIQNTIDILELQAENSLDSGQSGNIVRDFFYVEEPDSLYDANLQESSYLGTVDEDNTDAPYNWWENEYDNSKSVVSEDEKTMEGDDYEVIETIEQTGVSPYMTAIFDNTGDNQVDWWYAKVTYHYTDGTTEDSEEISGEGDTTEKIINPNPTKEIEKQELKGKTDESGGTFHSYHRYYRYEEAEDKKIQTNIIELIKNEKTYENNKQINLDSDVDTYELIKEFDNIEMYVDKVENEIEEADCKIEFYYDDGTDDSVEKMEKGHMDSKEYENPEPDKIVNKIEVYLKRYENEYDEPKEKNTEFYAYTLRDIDATHFQVFAWKPGISTTGNITAEVSFDNGSNYTTANIDEAAEIPEGERGTELIARIKLNAEDSDGLASCKGYGIMFW